MAELIMGQPIFAGDSGIDQLVEIIKVLGTPTREEIRYMNRDYKDYKQFPSIKPHPWNKLFPSDTPKEALDLMSKLLVYTPFKRIKPLEACTHPFFDNLRNTFSVSGSAASKLPSLFDLTPEELAYAHKHSLLEKLLLPEQYKALPSRYQTPPQEEKDTGKDNGDKHEEANDKSGDSESSDF